MQDIIVYIIVASAFVYLGRWFFKNVVVTNKKDDASCSSCSSCDTSERLPETRTREAR